MSRFTAVFSARYFVDFEAEGEAGASDFEVALQAAIYEAEDSGTPEWTLDNIVESI